MIGFMSFKVFILKDKKGFDIDPKKLDQDVSIIKGTGKVKLLPSSKVHDAIGKLNSNQIKHIINWK
ncbi:hypothetical protein GCM10008982_13670 [Anoxybacillus voinovskiensis]|nr:hypothetical protein GCM10008982_13670 [Anoxybacillus voinovskiensis]